MPNTRNLIARIVAGVSREPSLTVTMPLDLAQLLTELTGSVLHDSGAQIDDTFRAHTDALYVSLRDALEAAGLDDSDCPPRFDGVIRAKRIGASPCESSPSTPDR